jgi:LAO/AO transport system kinase
VASALESKGIEPVWETILEHRKTLEASGELERQRRDQARSWMWKLIEEGITRAFRNHPGMAEAIAAEERAVEDSKTTPAAAARTLLARFRS